MHFYVFCLKKKCIFEEQRDRRDGTDTFERKKSTIQQLFYHIKRGREFSNWRTPLYLWVFPKQLKKWGLISRHSQGITCPDFAAEFKHLCTEVVVSVCPSVLDKLHLYHTWRAACWHLQVQHVQEGVLEIATKLAGSRLASHEPSDQCF